MSLLSMIDTYLQSLGFQTSLIDAETTGIPQHLEVKLPFDEGRRTAEMRFTRVDEMIDAVAKTDSSPTYCAMFQVAVPLSFDTGSNHLVETLRAIVLLNRFLPIGNFVFAEETGRIYFSYTLLMGYSNFDETLVDQVMVGALYALTAYSDAIEKVASGEQSARQVVDEVTEASGATLSPVDGRGTARTTTN